MDITSKLTAKPVIIIRNRTMHDCYYDYVTSVKKIIMAIIIIIISIIIMTTTIKIIDMVIKIIIIIIIIIIEMITVGIVKLFLFN